VFGIRSHLGEPYGNRDSLFYMAATAAPGCGRAGDRHELRVDLLRPAAPG